MARLIISDFDRTLFRSDDHTSAVLSELLQATNLSHEQSRALKAELFQGETTVDIDRIISRLGHELTSLLDAVEMKSESFLYDDAQHLLDSVVDKWIVTTAVNVTEQQSKLRSAGINASQAKILLRQKKGEYLTDHARIAKQGIILSDYHPEKAFSEVLVVDDRFDAIEALIGAAGFKLVLLQREDAKYLAPSDLPDDVWVISTLQQLDL